MHADFHSEATETAIAYLSGQLDEQLSADYERHLSSCEACHQEVESLHKTLTSLLEAAPDAEPPDDLGERLFARIRRRSGETIERAAEARWENLPIPGVSRRLLFSDRVKGRETFILRMDPGTQLPKHGHGGTEECYVLDGDVRDGDLLMTAGDFSRYEAGTRHGPLVTKEGCLLLISAATGEAHP